MICRLQNETGEVLETVDDSNVLAEALPEITDERFHCLRFIDAYGDTVFNRLQMDRLLHELEIIGEDLSERHKRVLDRIADLGRKCKDDVHLYLKFVGD